MAVIKPFRCIRPAEDLAGRIAALPYDVYAVSYTHLDVYKRQLRPPLPQHFQQIGQRPAGIDDICLLYTSQGFCAVYFQKRHRIPGNDLFCLFPVIYIVRQSCDPAGQVFGGTDASKRFYDSHSLSPSPFLKSDTAILSRKQSTHNLKLPQSPALSRPGNIRSRLGPARSGKNVDYGHLLRIPEKGLIK